MRIKKLAEQLEGVQTIETIMSSLHVNRQKAIYCVYRLRKAGYVKTQRTPSRQRVYSISYENKQGGASYYEIINRWSPIKLAITQTYKIYGREITLEEAFMFALETKKVRAILASLSLFRKISDWKLLYRLARKNGLERKVGALYDLSRLLRIRTKRMDRRFRRLMLPKPGSDYQYILDGLRTSDERYKRIETRWRVYIPFNKGDLEDYL